MARATVSYSASASSVPVPLLSCSPRWCSRTPPDTSPSRRERRFLVFAGGWLVALWILASLLGRQPPLKTALLRCAPHCPASVFTVGSATTSPVAVRDAIIVALAAVVVGTPLLVIRRERASALPLRRAIAPVWLISIVTGLTGVLYYGSVILGLGDSPQLAAVFVATAATIPLAILFGLAAERLSMGKVLAGLVNDLAERPKADPEALISAALDDPSLRIAYRRPGRLAYVNAAGEAVPPAPEGRAMTLIDRRGRPIAAVSYSPELDALEQFIHAAAAAAMMRLEQTHLEAELKASTAELEASRARLMDVAHAERERLERDLHDGVQQQLTALRISLDLAAETAMEDPVSTERALEALGRRMDETLEAVRSLARGIYPALLRRSGLTTALQSAARASPIPATVRARRIGRYPEAIEVAVYFCCLEALQNVAKHTADEMPPPRSRCGRTDQVSASRYVTLGSASIQTERGSVGA